MDLQAQISPGPKPPTVETPMAATICRNCGDRFVQNRVDQIYCSAECRTAWNDEIKRQAMRLYREQQRQQSEAAE
jgi:hypothetical protein